MVGWRVFFHREAELPLGVAGDELVLRHAQVLARASARLRVGQPFLVGPDGTVDVGVNRWFVSDEVRGLSRSTWEKYAYSLKVWLSFLSAYGCRWDEADHGAQEAFKVWRVQDERNTRLVSLGTYDDNLIAPSTGPSPPSSPRPSCSPARSPPYVTPGTPPPKSPPASATSAASSPASSAPPSPPPPASSTACSSPTDRDPR